jgi:hypothetical protein
MELSLAVEWASLKDLPGSALKNALPAAGTARQ